MTKTAWAVMFALIGGTLAGCRTEEAIDRWASQATDSVDVVQSESAMLVASTDEIDSEMTAEEAASRAAQRSTTFYQPSTCVIATANGRTVVYELDDCTGPYGLVHVTGVVTVDYERRPEGIGYHAVATALKINGATVDIDNEGVYSVENGTKRIEATTKGEGTGPRGNRFTREGDYVFTWNGDSRCLSLDGSWETVVNEDRAAWTTEVSDFRLCEGACPDAGGSISWISRTNSLSVSYDGTATASWETGKGRQGTVELFCE